MANEIEDKKEETPVKTLTQDELANMDPTMLPPAEHKKEFVIPTIPIEMHAGKFNKDRIRCMIYGDSGAGKTVFASSWPNPIFLDLDQGMASVHREVARVSISNWAELQNAYLFLAYAKHDFKTVVVDSLNETQWQAMADTIDKYPNVRRSYGDLASMSDYGKALSDFDKFVRYMRSLPFNVVFLAQLAKRESEEEMFQPQFTGKATAQNVCRMMDLVGFIYKGDSVDANKPRVITFDDSKFMAKDRSGKLPSQIQGTFPHPNYDDLAQYWA
jgi:hypothetical protein